MFENWVYVSKEKMRAWSDKWFNQTGFDHNLDYSERVEKSVKSEIGVM